MGETEEPAPVPVGLARGAVHWTQGGLGEREFAPVRPLIAHLVPMRFQPVYVNAIAVCVALASVEQTSHTAYIARAMGIV